jgi:hypothetical protein
MGSDITIIVMSDPGHSVVVLSSQTAIDYHQPNGQLDGSYC